MQKHFSYKTATIFYQDIGQGQSIVLLHGFGEDHFIWHNQVESLSKKYRVIMPDLPGSGQSDLLDIDNVSIEDYATCIMQLLVHEKIAKCIILGHSMGGYIALAFAEKYTSMLVAFGLIHSTAFADTAEKKETRLKSIQFLKENNSYTFLKTSIPNLFSAKTKRENDFIITSLIERGSNFSAEALIQYSNAMMNRPDRTEVLKSTTLPVLFIVGEEDIAAPLVDLLKQVPLPKISVVNILKEVGHMGMLENANALTKFLLSFCSFAYEGNSVD